MSGALSQYALIGKSILRARYSPQFEESLAGPSLTPATRKKGKPAITQEMLAQSATRRPVLLIGDVGVGKTMFIRHFIKVAAAEDLNDAIVLYLDLGIKPTLDSDLDQYLEEEITRQLFDIYKIDIFEDKFVRGVHNIELHRFSKGIFSAIRQSAPEEYRRQKIAFLESILADREAHLSKALTHISKGWRRQIVIFLDNVDQRSYDFQQQAFLVGQSMAELWPALVFVSLRPETYHLSKHDGTLSAYHSKAFVISPPRVDQVIQKRLRYALQLVDSGDIGTSVPGIEMDVDLRDLLDYLKILKFSFRHSAGLAEFVDNVCGGNIRLALDFVGTFLGSGHVNTAKILEIFRADGRYHLALHEFLRAVIYGDYRDYDPSRSEIVNIFDIGGADGKEHFLAPTILAFLDVNAQAYGNSGFVTAAGVYEYAQSTGYHPARIQGALDKMLGKKLIETPAKTKPTSFVDNNHSDYRITTIGAYYYQRLTANFTYIDAIITDTPIVIREMRDRIIDELTIVGRLDRAEVFRRYLDRVWNDMPGISQAFDWMVSSERLSREIQKIRTRVDRSVLKTRTTLD